MAQRDEIESEAAGSGLETESRLRLARGDRRRHREMGVLLGIVTANRRRRDSRLFQQLIEQEPRAGTALAIDEAYLLRRDVRERLQVLRVSGLHDQALFALGEPDQCIAARIEQTPEAGRHAVLPRHDGVKAGDIRLAALQRLEALDASAKRQLADDARRLGPLVAETREQQVVACDQRELDSGTPRRARFRDGELQREAAFR